MCNFFSCLHHIIEKKKLECILHQIKFSTVLFLTLKFTLQLPIASHNNKKLIESLTYRFNKWLVAIPEMVAR
jgi:hypothetical protein